MGPETGRGRGLCAGSWLQPGGHGACVGGTQDRLTDVGDGRWNALQGVWALVLILTTAPEGVTPAPPFPDEKLRLGPGSSQSPRRLVEMAFHPGPFDTTCFWVWSGSPSTRGPRAGAAGDTPRLTTGPCGRDHTCLWQQRERLLPRAWPMAGCTGAAHTCSTGVGTDTERVPNTRPQATSKAGLTALAWTRCSFRETARAGLLGPWVHLPGSPDGGRSGAACSLANPLNRKPAHR